MRERGEWRYVVRASAHGAARMPWANSVLGARAVVSGDGRAGRGWTPRIASSRAERRPVRSGSASADAVDLPFQRRQLLHHSALTSIDLREESERFMMALVVAGRVPLDEGQSPAGL